MIAYNAGVPCKRWKEAALLTKEGLEFMNDFLITLEIMGKGMAGIFTAIILIMIVVWIMGKVAGVSGKPKKSEDETRMP